MYGVSLIIPSQFRQNESVLTLLVRGAIDHNDLAQDNVFHGMDFIKRSKVFQVIKGAYS